MPARLSRRAASSDRDAWESAHDSFVTDRTTVDQLAYFVLHDVYGVDAAYLDTAVSGLQRYTHVVYCPVGVFCNPVGDPARVQDPAYHHLYDTLVDGLCRRAGRAARARRDGWPLWLELRHADLDARKRVLDRFVQMDRLS